MMMKASTNKDVELASTMAKKVQYVCSKSSIQTQRTEFVPGMLISRLVYVAAIRRYLE
jgi:hypothetical protein